MDLRLTNSSGQQTPSDGGFLASTWGTRLMARSARAFALLFDKDANGSRVSVLGELRYWTPFSVTLEMNQPGDWTAEVALEDLHLLSYRGACLYITDQYDGSDGLRTDLDWYAYGLALGGPVKTIDLTQDPGGQTAKVSGLSWTGVLARRVVATTPHEPHVITDASGTTTGGPTYAKHPIPVAEQPMAQGGAIVEPRPFDIFPYSPTLLEVGFARPKAAASECIRHYVDVNAAENAWDGRADPRKDRRIPGLYVPAAAGEHIDQASIGLPLTKYGRWENLLEFCQDIAKEGAEDYSYTLPDGETVMTKPQLVFEVVPNSARIAALLNERAHSSVGVGRGPKCSARTRRPRDLSGMSNPDQAQAVVEFNDAYDAVTNVSISREAPEVTMIYSAGSEDEGYARPIVPVWDEDQFASGWLLAERFLDGGINSTTTGTSVEEDAYTGAAKRELIDGRAKLKVSATAVTNRFFYGVHYLVGDLCAVVIDGYRYVEQITSVNIQIDGEGVQVEINIGADDGGIAGEDVVRGLFSLIGKSQREIRRMQTR